MFAEHAVQIGFFDAFAALVHVPRHRDNLTGGQYLFGFVAVQSQVIAQQQATHRYAGRTNLRVWIEFLNVRQRFGYIFNVSRTIEPWCLPIADKQMNIIIVLDKSAVMNIPSMQHRLAPGY